MSFRNPAQGGQADMPWEPEAQDALGKVPFFVRPLVRKKVADQVAASGGQKVTLDDFKRAEAKFRAVRGGKSDKELESLLPAANRAGVQMVILEACRNELAGCPNSLIGTGVWHQAVSDWLEAEGVSELLRQKVGGDTILFHHKLKIAIAGCPNGCSRPQIADLALVGQVTPDCAHERCTGCGACREACPDRAIQLGDEGPLFDRDACLGCLVCKNACAEGCISLSPPRVRVLIGGKLGRHPHLAEQVAATDDPQEAVAVFDRAVKDYLKQGRPNERFAAWWARSQKGLPQA